MPRGEMEKISGTICNIPIDTTNVTNMLPRHADNNGLVIIKLKHKLEYHDHVLFEPVRSVFLKRILNYLKTNNHLYQDLFINTTNISLDGSAWCTSYDKLDTSKQTHEVTSNCKILSSEILNTPVIPIILQCGETLEKAIENFEEISNFEYLGQHINTPIPIILEPIDKLEETEKLIEFHLQQLRHVKYLLVHKLMLTVNV